ncbi:MAG TPA: NAD(P)/FAD-dependent oxidoreductase [Sphingobium sp.]
MSMVEMTPTVREGRYDEPDADFIARALDQANPNALRLALYQATSDPALADVKVGSVPWWGGVFQVTVLSAEDGERVKEKARAFLSGEKRGQVDDAPSGERLRALIETFAGEPVSDFMVEMGREELSFDAYPRGVEWTKEPSEETKRSYHVTVIGAGIGGIAAGIQLKRLGIPFIIVDENDGIGGTWWKNDYPDARVDIASHHFQYSFMHNYRWKHNFAPAGEVQKYIEQAALDHDLIPHIRLNSKLTAAEWDEGRAQWRLTLDGDGAQEIRTSAIISAAGLFNRPNKPDIPGLDSFEGPWFHSTEWDHGVEYHGKRIGIVGVGSTGAQIMPRVAQDAAHVSVFQRSPQWVATVDGYKAEVTPETQWLFDTVPYYWNWYCFALFHAMFGDVEGLQNADPEWQAKGGIISERNDNLRSYLAENIRTKLADRPDLIAKLIPDFPPFTKRTVIDNGWFDALRRDNVDLVTEGIDRITPGGVKTKDGKEHPVDLLVLSAGFKTEDYLWPVQYSGVNGVTLERAWAKDGARSYLGMTMPHFPNLFVVYGPNGQARAGGLFPWIEIWVRYAVHSVVRMIEAGAHVMECRQSVFDDYNAKMDKAMEHCIWDVPGQQSYYLNKFGRTSANMPWKPDQYYHWIKEPDLADFDLR